MRYDCSSEKDKGLRTYCSFWTYRRPATYYGEMGREKNVETGDPTKGAENG